MPPTAKAFARAPRCSPQDAPALPATTAATAHVTTNAWHERAFDVLRQKKVQTPRIPRRPNLRSDSIEQPRCPEKSLESQPKKIPAGPPVRPFFGRETRQLAVLRPARSAIIHHSAALFPAGGSGTRATAGQSGACRTRGSARSARKQGPRPAPEVAARGKGRAAQCPRAAIDFPLMASMMGAASPLQGALRWVSARHHLRVTMWMRALSVALTAARSALRP